MFKNDEIRNLMGDKSHTLAEFNDLLGSRMNPTAKANYLKGLSVANVVDVALSVNRDTGEFESRITVKNSVAAPTTDSANDG